MDSDHILGERHNPGVFWHARAHQRGDARAGRGPSSVAFSGLYPGTGVPLPPIHNHGGPAKEERAPRARLLRPGHNDDTVKHDGGARALDAIGETMRVRKRTFE